MMRALNFSKRNFKELIRDPLSTIFALILPLFLLFIFQTIKIPSEQFNIENFTPGIIVFGSSFLTLFTSMLVSKDRASSLLIRLGVSPMKTTDYIFGYVLSFIPVIIIQNILFFILACFFGLQFSYSMILTVLTSIIIGMLYIVIGLLLGSCFNDKTAPPLSSIIIQLVCFTSGMYFPKEMVGDIFAKICGYLPFESCVTIIKGIMNNTIEIISLKNIVVFVVYTIVILVLSIIVFKKKMISDNN